MKQYPKYPAYQESGEPWIGGVPQHWTVDKLGNCLKPFSDKGHPDEQLLSITRELGVIERDSENDEDNHNFIPDDLSGYKLLKKGQFGMNKMKAWQGSYGVSQFRGIVSPAYFTFNLREEINPRYFHIAVRSKGYVPFFGRASDGVRIGQWDLSKSRMKEIPFLIPPDEEQTAIADFLDDKTAKIDKAIAQKQQLIALLKERKQIIIQNAVTKGLDPTVKMKDSGIEWIGEIPEHWEKTSIRYLLVKLEQGDSPTASNDFDTTYVLKLSAVKNGSFSLEETKPIKKNSYQERFQIQQNDFLLTRGNTPELVGDTCLVDRPVNSQIMFSDLIYRLSFKLELVDLRFILAIFQSGYMRKQISSSAVGSSSSMVKVSQSDIKSWFVFLPSKKEQELTIQRLSKDFDKMDKAASDAFRSIQTLREYRATLIDSAVTGKIKVPGL